MPSGDQDSRCHECESLLAGAVRVLLVEDNGRVREAMCRYFSAPVYDLTCVASQREAVQRIEQQNGFHICLMDLGVDDVGGDQFHLVRQFGGEMGVIVVTGSQSPRDGAACRDMGVKDILEKAFLDRESCLASVNHWVLAGLLWPEYTETSRGSKARAVRILLGRRPESIAAWARMAGLEERSLRRLWDGHGGSLRHLFRLCELYRTVFDILAADNAPLPAALEARWIRERDYFVANRQAMQQLMAPERERRLRSETKPQRTA